VEAEKERKRDSPEIDKKDADYLSSVLAEGECKPSL